MSRVFHIPIFKLRDAQIEEALTAKFPIKLAKESWVFPVAEKAQQLTLAVADPTHISLINEVKRRVNPNVELRIATASEVLEQIESHYGPKLVGVLPSGEKIEYSISRHETEIGKAAHNHVVLTDQTVSNTHAIILNRDGGYSIVDLGSRNGTFLNGQRVHHERRLAEASSIEINPYRLRIFFDPAQAEYDIRVSDESTGPATPVGEPTNDVEQFVQKLTPTEHLVYKALLRGLSRKDISSRLGMKTETVHTHTKAIYKVFRVESHPELMAKCCGHR